MWLDVLFSTPLSFCIGEYCTLQRSCRSTMAMASLARFSFSRTEPSSPVSQDKILNPPECCSSLPLEHASHGQVKLLTVNQGCFGFFYLRLAWRLSKGACLCSSRWSFTFFDVLLRKMGDERREEAGRFTGQSSTSLKATKTVMPKALPPCHGHFQERVHSWCFRWVWGTWDKIMKTWIG